jgi:hypothetical protein
VNKKVIGAVAQERRHDRAVITTYETDIADEMAAWAGRQMQPQDLADSPCGNTRPHSEPNIDKASMYMCWISHAGPF